MSAGTDVWPAGRPAALDTQTPPAPPVQRRPHRLHTAPDLGTTPRTGGQPSKLDELSRSLRWMEGKETCVLRMAAHLGEEKPKVTAGEGVSQTTVLSFVLSH